MDGQESWAEEGVGEEGGRAEIEAGTKPRMGVLLPMSAGVR
jgi:hypothetical protein